MMNSTRFAGLTLLVLTICMPAWAQVGYDTKMTSGPFYVSQDARSVDWILVNNDAVSVEVRVTVFRLPVGLPKVPRLVRVFTLAPGVSTHDANGASFESLDPIFWFGHAHEIVVEATSEKVHANVNQWSNTTAAYVMPETVIPAGAFVTIKKPKRPEKP